jgi:hypothetical protein
VEGGALVAESLLSGAQSTEVLRGLGHNVRAQLLKNKFQFNGLPVSLTRVPV